MKGFVRILEAVIASIILLAAASYFFIIEPQASEWDIALLQTRAQDAMSTLDNAGVLKESIMKNDKESFYRNMEKIMPNSLKFYTVIENRVNPEIHVSFIGNIAEFENNIGRSPIIINFTGRNSTVFVRQTTIDNIDNDTDVILIWGFAQMPQDRTKLENFLKEGKAIFLFSDLNQAQTGNEIMRDLFGLSWKGAGNRGTIRFYDAYNPNRTSYFISNRFENISSINKTVVFTGFNNNQINIDNRTIIAGSSFSYVKSNYDIIKGNGRTVWFARYNFNDKNATNAFLSSLLWTASERYDFNPVYVAKPPGNNPFYEYKYFVYDREPYTVNIKIWQVFY